MTESILPPVTLSELSAATRQWLDAHSVLPNVPAPIADGYLADGTRVTVAFHPDAFGSDVDSGRQPVPVVMYRLQRDGRMSMTPISPAFIGDYGFEFVHPRAVRALEGL